MKLSDPARLNRSPHHRVRSRCSVTSEIIYGRNPVMEALSSGSRTFYEIMVLSQNFDELNQSARDIPVRIVPREELEKSSLTLNHQGIAAQVSPYRYATLADMTDLVILILLDSVEDPQNLGSIIRSAYALAGAGVVIPEHRAASVTPAVVKASSGATERTRIARVHNLRDAGRELKNCGYWLVGLDATAQDDICRIPKFDKVALVIGGEDSGIRPIIAKGLDLVARIPMKGHFNSLNVAQAAGIALYELAARTK
jgi:23S rRNA (guanosine2251-2'-O)-methyltransferase